MAFNWQTFYTRAFTALIFAAVMLTGLFWNQWAFFVLFAIIHFGCWFEYQQLVGKFVPEYAAVTAFHRYGIMLAGFSLLLYFGGSGLAIGSFSLHALGWWTGLLFLFVLPLTELLFTRHISLVPIGYSAFGLLYISLSLALLIDLRSNSTLGYLLPVCIVFSIWINDTMAYLVGSVIGKTPLTAISPKKTWEGTLGGIIFSVATMGILAYFTHHTILPIAIIAAIAAITGTFGDLLESKLKRMASVKDSGKIMPGHGGFLDRFDSLLVAVPFVWIYVKLVLSSQ
jgi:phosphatidate cytidylyltransferase